MGVGLARKNQPPAGKTKTKKKKEIKSADAINHGYQNVIRYLPIVIKQRAGPAETNAVGRRRVANR